MPAKHDRSNRSDNAPQKTLAAKELRRARRAVARARRATLRSR